ncbi:hypothetical protein HNR46_001063 [Haloferula luteola]|uniref:O-antigen ligase-related domain-containing protein n=1 Tax=Haloferula luteola TaxID=595692 RepID=A0A840VAK7_9BACT|nr:O-antigen ligase family protein [Haloferula luteola]MBB5350829.1 hypothetical protein [Haloferula luteola]
MFVIPLLILCAILSVLIGRKCQVSVREGIVAVLMMFPMPLSEVVGFHFPVFISDLVPFLLFIVFYRRFPANIFNDRVSQIAFLLLIVIPFTSVGASLIVQNADDSRHYLYLYRKAAAFGFIYIAARNYRDINPIHIIKVGCIFWAFISLMGLLNYLGIYSLPSYIEEKDDDVKGSAFESYKLVRGFLAYNRGAIGLYGCIFIVFVFCKLVILKVSPDPKWIKIVYVITALASMLNIIFSGTRTGVIVGAFVLCVLFFQYSWERKTISIGAIAILAVLAISGYFVLSHLSQNRFTQIESDNSLNARTVIQRIAIEHSFSNVGSFLIGNGIRPFAKINPAGFTHAHSEYFDILYLNGWFALVFYISLSVIFWFSFGRNQETRYILRGILMVGAIFGLTIGHYMVTEPRLASLSHFLLFCYSLAYFRNKNRLVKNDR